MNGKEPSDNQIFTITRWATTNEDKPIEICGFDTKNSKLSLQSTKQIRDKHIKGISALQKDIGASIKIQLRCTKCNQDVEVTREERGKGSKYQCQKCKHSWCK